MPSKKTPDRHRLSEQDFSNEGQEWMFEAENLNIHPPSSKAVQNSFLSGDISKKALPVANEKESGSIMAPSTLPCFTVPIGTIIVTIISYLGCWTAIFECKSDEWQCRLKSALGNCPTHWCNSSPEQCATVIGCDENG